MAKPQSTGAAAPAKAKAEAQPKQPKEKKPTRQERIRQATEGREFVYVEQRTGHFTCICGGKGSKAHVVRDVGSNEELLVGTTCLKYTGVALPRKPRGRKPSQAGEEEGEETAGAQEGEGEGEEPDPLASIVGEGEEE